MSVPAHETFAFTEEDLAEDTAEQKEVWMVHGEKGTGKTTFACGFKGSKLLLSFDRKAKRIKERMYLGSQEIKVYDTTRFYRELTKDELPKAGAKSIAYVLELMEHAQDVDWVVIDAYDMLIEMAEMKMRYDNGFGAFDGVDFQFWKDRKVNLRLVHGTAINLARKGVIYTTISEENRFVEAGRLIRQTKAPRWVDIVMYETDNVVRCEIRQHPKLGTRFVAILETVKVGGWPSGAILDVTDRTISEASPVGAPTEAEEKAVEALFQ